MIQFNSKIPPEPPLLRINPFRGINLSVSPTQINDLEAADMLNMNLDERGALNKRTGYEKAFPTSLGTGKINGDYIYYKKDGTVKRLLAHGTKLYTWSYGNQPTEIYSGIADSPVMFFTMNDKCYIMDGTNYLIYDGTTVSSVTPYIPTLTISTPPAGGGTSYEDFNLLGAGFKQSFSADGTATVYQLSLTNLDSTTVTATVDGAAKTEGTDFTVDRTLGKVTFGTAPASGTNNVIITAYKTFTGYAERIKNCTVHVLFGGNNDTRVFWSGNPNYPNWMWRSGLYDPSYAPENGFYKLGSDVEKIQGFAKQYDYCVIEKERSKWVMHYDISSGTASFLFKPINDQIGTYAKKTIQLIENDPISLDSTGVYRLVASNVRDERNVEHISANIDQRLLAEPNLDKAISVDYDRKYWIAVNGNVYVYDYALNEWYIYDNIHASLFTEYNGDFYFGSDSEGMVYRFYKSTDLKPYNDDGVAINAYWKSKQFAFNADERLKLVGKAFFTLKPNTHTSADLYYISNKKTSALVKTRRMDLLDFRDIDFNKFTFIVSSFPQEANAKIKAKKITHFQLYLKNDKLNESMGITSVGIKYIYQNLVK